MVVLSQSEVELRLRQWLLLEVHDEVLHDAELHLAQHGKTVGMRHDHVGVFARENDAHFLEEILLNAVFGLGTIHLGTEGRCEGLGGGLGAAQMGGLAGLVVAGLDTAGVLAREETGLEILCHLAVCKLRVEVEHPLLLPSHLQLQVQPLVKRRQVPDVLLRLR